MGEIAPETGQSPIHVTTPEEVLASGLGIPLGQPDMPADLIQEEEGHPVEIKPKGGILTEWWNNHFPNKA